MSVGVDKHTKGRAENLRSVEKKCCFTCFFVVSTDWESMNALNFPGFTNYPRKDPLFFTVAGFSQKISVTLFG